MRLLLIATLCLGPASALAGDLYGNRVDRNFVPPAPPPKSFTTYRTYDLGPSPSFSRPSSSAPWRPSSSSSGSSSAGEPRSRASYAEELDEERQGDCAAGRVNVCLSLGFAREKTRPADALPYYEKSCTLGSVEGCMKVGEMYEAGKAVRQNLVRAAQAYERACGMGNGQACFQLSSCYEAGTCGTIKSLTHAARLEAKACAHGFGRGCAWEGLRLLKGEGVPRDPKAAREKLERACTAKVGEACYFLGVHLQNGLDLPRDTDAGLRLLKEACQLKHKEGCVARNVAQLEDPDPSTRRTSCTLLEVDCDLYSHPHACWGAGTAYLNGKGPEPDVDKAVPKLRKACDAKHLMACVDLGLAYWKGSKKMPPDHAKALQAAQRACDGGLALGCNNFAWALLKGEGIPRDPTRAMTLLRKTDADGEMAAADSLGDVYAEGLAGVAVDRARAREYYRKACSAGYETSCAKQAALTPPRAGRKAR